MKRIYECEKCGKQFTNEEECIKHEENCTDLREEDVVTTTINWLDNMTDEEYEAYSNALMQC